LQPLVRYQPHNGLSDQVFHIFLADGATRVGAPTDPGEAERVEWVPVDRVRRLAKTEEILDGLSLTAVLYALAFNAIG
jgi:hypothetical protein